MPGAWSSNLKMQTVDTSKRLEDLRRYMALPEYNVDALVIPSEDGRESYSSSLSVRPLNA